MEKIKKSAFCVIGMPGSTDDGEGFVQKLWEKANSRFGEVAALMLIRKSYCISANKRN